MRQLEETSYGYRITLQAPCAPATLHALLSEVEEGVSRRGDFGVLVDLRSVAAFSIEVQEALKTCIDRLKTAGMGRQAVVLDGAIATLQAQRLSKEMGILDLCRYLDASNDSGWERASLEWLVRGLDPHYR